MLFVNAAEHFEKGKRQNQLKPEDITKIIETYQFRKEETRYTRRLDMAKIEENGFNLTISRYISVMADEVQIDFAATPALLIEIEDKIKAATAKHNKFLKELGLPLLP